MDDRSIKSISSPEPWEFLLFSGIAALYLLAAVLWMRRKDITYTAE